MRSRVARVLAALIVILGLSAVFVPKYVFPICEADHLTSFSSYQPAMRCFWFARAEILLGLIVALAGLLLLFRPTPHTQFAIGAVLIVMGLVIILVSTNAVIGSTCGHARSICQIGTKPALRIVGVIVAVLGVIMAASNAKRCKQ